MPTTSRSNSSSKSEPHNDYEKIIDDHIANTIARLPEGQLLQHTQLSLHNPSSKEVQLKSGDTLPSEVVIDKMLRLELLAMANPEVFEALVKHTYSGKKLSEIQMSVLGAHKLGHVETLSLRNQFFKSIFRTNIGSIYEAAPPPEICRYQFSEMPETRGIILSAVTMGPKTWKISSPEVQS